MIKGTRSRVGVISGIATLLVVSILGMTNSVNLAQASLITEEEHWKYNINTWIWDSKIRETVGLITPKIIIENETSGMLEGYVADVNGTRLEFYDGDQVVRTRFIFDEGPLSSWQMSGMVHDGYFKIDIPERFQGAHAVRIYIGNNDYTVDNGSPTTPPTRVLTNSASLIYRMNLTDQQPQTQIAHSEPLKPISDISEVKGSLIDWILSQNNMAITYKMP